MVWKGKACGQTYSISPFQVRYYKPWTRNMDIPLEALADKVLQDRHLALWWDVIGDWNAGKLGEACAVEGFACDAC